MLYILLPIFVTQIVIQLMAFFDTVMCGNYRTSDLAGTAIATSITVPIHMGINGIFFAMTPIVAQHVGAKKQQLIASSVTQAGVLAIIFGIIVIGIGICTVDPVLRAMKLDVDVHQVAKQYLQAISFGIIPSFLYMVLRASIDGLGLTRITMTITLLSFPINVLLNYLFIFGKWGLPSFGGAGAGIATAITYLIITSVTVGFLRYNNRMREMGMLRIWKGISFPHWKEMLRIGLPLGLSIFFEVSIFSVVTILMSKYNTATIAACQAAMNFASLLYMLPLSIAMSLTILVGFEVGAKRFHDAKVYARLGIFFSISLATLCAIYLLLFHNEVAGMYMKEETVREITATFLIYAIFFQFSDAVGTPVQGTLNGYKDVNAVFFITLTSYWIIGLPFGYILATWTDLQAYGYWVGLISGLTAGAVTLFTRLWYVEQRSVKAGAII